ncbi:hypothetical protein WA026_018286 [Henosepilachna vigintioctopunctata]|uniref:Transmembrane protein 14C n=1 Tax=Henosepilachna vigintioctopunctata TaxID=420089 RepID=A0AAW1V9Q2_9CUCU
MTGDIIGFFYAGIVAAGGIVGYVKAGSIPSLVAGLVFGSALIYGAYQQSVVPPNYIPQLVTASILTGAMGCRFYNSGKIVPAGLICIISVAVIVKIALGASGLLTGWLGSRSKKSSLPNVTFDPHSTSTLPTTSLTTEA